MALQGPAARRWSKRILGIALVLLVLAVLRGTNPPSPVPATAAPTEFSAERAMAHVRAISTEPHPAGTPAADRVRDYIVEALATMGVETEVDVTTLALGDRLNNVHNVFGRIRGTANTKAFALVAHYDSTCYGPGAADDGSGVATMLETARAIKSAPPLMNDILFVFTDGEERGLVGARAFARHPAANGVGLLLNMETRGTSGPSGMFETTANNGWLIRELIRSGASVRATSLSYDVYQYLPTRTDLTALRQAGLKGYNIAFIEDLAYYHSPNDNPDKLSLASLQHHGSYAVNLARHLGNTPLDNIPSEPDAIFFNIFGPIMIQYPGSIGWPLVVAACFAFGCAVWFGLRRSRLTPNAMAAGACMVLMAGGIAAVVTGAIMAAAWYVHNVYVLYNTARLTPVLLGITMLVALWTLSSFRKRISSANLVAGTLCLWLLIMIIVQVFFPNGAYVALWPLIGGTIGLILLITAPVQISGRRVWLHALCGLPGILLIVPFMRGMLASLTLFMAPPLMMPVVLVLGLFAPQVRYVFSVETSGRPARRAFMAAIVPLSALLIFSLAGKAAPDAPIMNSVSYGLDRSKGQAWWMSTDKKPDEWTSQFFPPDTPKLPVREFVPSERAPRLKTPAPIAPLPAPTVEVVSSTLQPDGTRAVSLRLTSLSRAPEIQFRIEPPTRVIDATVDGEEVRRGARSRIHAGWSFSYRMAPRSGVANIDLVVNREGLIDGKILEVFYELPPLPCTPRPSYMMNKSNTLDWLEKNRLASGHTYILTPFSF